MFDDKRIYKESLKRDRGETLMMAFLFLASVAAVFGGVTQGLQGHFVRRVSYNDIVIAIGSFAMLGFPKRGRVIDTGAACCGTGAAIRALTHYLHAPSRLQRLAAMNGQALKLIGFLLFAISSALWLRDAHRQKGMPQEHRSLP